MKFVCERCQTRYSIADEKVRQKILKIRCKTCDNVITVREESALSDAPPAVVGKAPKLAAAAVPVAAPVLPAGSSQILPSSLPARPRPLPPPPPPRSDPGPAEWFLAVDGQETGPFRRADAAARIFRVPPTSQAHVWKEGFDGWKEPVAVPELARELASLRTHAPTLPPPAPPRSTKTIPATVPATVPAVPGLPTTSNTTARAKAVARARTPVPRTPTPTQAPQTFGAQTSFDDEHTQIEGGGRADMAVQFPNTPGAKTPLVTSSYVGQNAANQAAARALDPASSNGLEALNFGTQAGFAGGTGAFAPSPGFGPPPSASMSTGQSGLSQLTALGFFDRNPAMKYVVLAGVVVALLVVLMIGYVNRTVEVKAVAPAPAPTKPIADVDPEQAARDRAAQWFAGGNEPSKVPVLPAPTSNAKPGFFKHLFNGNKAQPQPNPAPTPNAPPPANFTEPNEERAVKPALADRERAIKPVGPSSSSQGPGVPQDAIRNVVTSRTNQDALKACYNRALKGATGSQIKGRMDINVAIGASGKVKGVTVSSPPELQPVNACIKTAVSRWLFPAGGEEYAASFPVFLQGS